MSILEPEPERTIAQFNFNKLLLLLSNTFTKSQKKYDYDYLDKMNTIEKSCDLNKKVIREIMTSRKDTFTLNIDDDISDILECIQNENHTKIPVYEKYIDNIIGVLYVDELLESIKNENINNVNIRTLLRKPKYIPEVKKIDEVVDLIKDEEESVFILVDEYGGFSGIVTTSDLMYEVEGTNYNKCIEFSKIKKIDENNYVVKGFVSIHDFNKIFDTNIKAGSYDTIGGYIISELGKIPTGDKSIQLNVGNIILKLLKMNRNRVEDIQVSILD